MRDDMVIGEEDMIFKGRFLSITKVTESRVRSKYKWSMRWISSVSMI